MFSDKYLIQLQENISYRFSDIFLLEKALTTAGAEGDKESQNSEERDRYDGNRKLANIGDKLLQLVVMVNVFSEGDKRRSDASDAVLSAADKDILEARAKDFEIDKHMKLNPRLRGRPTKTTLSTAVNAIIGAAWQDSQEDMDTARSVIERFGINERSNYYAKPGVRRHQQEAFIGGIMQDVFNELPNLLNNENDFQSSSLVPEITPSTNHTTSRLVSDQTYAYELQAGPELPGLPLRSTSPGAMQERRPKDPESRSKKRKLPHRVSKTTQIENYIRFEQDRCRALGLPLPQADLASTLEADKVAVGDNDLVTLNILYFGIASPESLVTLRDLASVQRRPFTGKLTLPRWDLSPKERVEAIEALNDNVMYMSFLKRCHILELFRSLSGSHKTSDGFVHETIQSISRNPRSQLGNPLVMEDSRISKGMLAQLYPDLDQKSPEYSRKERSVNRLRKIGQRLDLLVQNFGFGMIGLIPLPTDGGEQAFNITDTLLLSTPNNVFGWFVRYLEDRHGEFLRRASDAVSDMLSAIWKGNLDPSKKFGIELVEREQIMGYPKSMALLDRILQSQVLMG